MGNPVIGIGSSVLMDIETVPGDREAMTSGNHLDLISESLDYIPVAERIITPMGTRYHDAAYEFVSHNDASGSFVTRARHAYMVDLLTWILGTATPHVPIADNTDLPTATIECLKAGAGEVVLVGAKVNTATFRSSTNSPLEIELNVVGMTGERDPADLTAFTDTAWAASIPYIHGRMSIDATGEAWLGGADGPEARSLEFTINNNLDIEGYTNSMTRKIIPVGIFELEGSMEIPYNSTTHGFWVEMVNSAVVSFDVVYSDGSKTTTFTFKVKLEGELPGITGAENIWLTLGFHGVLDGAAKPISAVVSA